MTKEECEIETSKAIMEMRNHIAELKKENTELKEKLNNLASVAEERLANWQKYEKAYNEAEELLDKQIEATYKLFEENKEAKEIIKELLFTSNELDENTRSKAEQFLKEVKE